ncbi:solute carrier family 12 member 7-like [Mya arenaria]|uniref:solute carrier family 12 member 7-like n=1 Tax=Mya arenaria TaxID=6604 RepID=UPI0022E59BB3|nr:solute carrier family 12 member 7-like [Mya arenaria]XP_052817096.1 solute carrier family 12 member 7-like [Mya arenaria]
MASSEGTKNVRFTVVPTSERNADNDTADATETTGGSDDDAFTAGVTAVHRDTMALYKEDLVRGSIARVISTSSMSNVRTTKVSFSEDVPEQKDEVPDGPKGTLGTLLGVYLPTIQNIFGVLIFIRVTWLVGMAGTIEGFFIIFLCCCTTTLTSISMSAIATNGIVPAGGSYFMISRALGPEFGGAVGCLFYLGFTVAGSMYVIGAIEILVTFIAPNISLFGDVTELSNAINNYRVYGTCLLLLLFLLCFVGVQFVAKFGPVSLFCVIISIICIYIGLFIASPERSIKICYLGERLLTLASVTVNGTMMCTRNESGPLFARYCTVRENGTFCDPYFLEHETRLVPGIPGFTSGNFIENIPHRYTEKGNIIGQTVPGDRDRGEIIADLTSTFTVLMAIYFPSVTGIMTGSNMSGDLKDAQKSIPTGTIAAVLSTSAVYLSLTLGFASCIEGDLLRDKLGESLGGGMVVAYIAWPTKWMVLIGAFLSTIGAGLQSINTAPRLLYAISKDGIVPFLKVFSVTKRGEPFYALLLTVGIAEAGVLVGNLDHVTPVITMFFLMCYLFVNMACAVQTLLRAPSWRPRYKFYHWSLSLIGVGLCTTLMIISSWYFALAAFVLAGGIYKYIEYKGAEKEWGDGIRGMAMSLARYSLLKVQQSKPHTKNWRPQMLVLSKLNDHLIPKYQKIITLAGQLKAGKGFVLVCSVLDGDVKRRAPDIDRARENIQKVMEQENVKGFKDVLVSKSLLDGLSYLVQTAGLGGLRPNTVMIGWPEDWRHAQNNDTPNIPYKHFIHTVEVIEAMGKALLVVKDSTEFPDNQAKMRGTIDVWWIVHDGGLLLLLPYLLRQHRAWKNCKLRVFTVAQIEENTIQLKKDLQKFMYQLRIEAEVEVVELSETDISEYTYERTLEMEQRAEMLNKLKDRRESATQRQLETVDNIRRGSRHEIKIDLPHVEDDGETQQYTFTPSSSKRPSTMKFLAEPVNRHIPTEENVHQMHTAVRLNELIRANSCDAQLVIVNLPPPPHVGATDDNSDLHYMEFLEVLTEDVGRVLMVRGSGTEVITIYS